MAGKFLLQWDAARSSYKPSCLPYLIQIRRRWIRYGALLNLLVRTGGGTSFFLSLLVLNNQLKIEVPNVSFRVAKLWSPSHSSIPQISMEHRCGYMLGFGPHAEKSQGDICQHTELRGQLQKRVRLPGSNGDETCDLALEPESNLGKPMTHTRPGQRSSPGRLRLLALP